MTVKEVITKSDVTIGLNNPTEDNYVNDLTNCVPTNGADLAIFGNQPCFFDAEKFIEVYGEYEAEKCEQAPSDEDVPEEIYGKQYDYYWYQVCGTRVIFGVW